MQALLTLRGAGDLSASGEVVQGLEQLPGAFRAAQLGLQQGERTVGRSSGVGYNRFTPCPSLDCGVLVLTSAGAHAAMSAARSATRTRDVDVQVVVAMAAVWGCSGLCASRGAQDHAGAAAR